MDRAQNAGMYIHIPFCEAKCPYCDFYSVAASESRMDAYADSLVRAIQQAPAPGPVDTLYFGGGTPNLMGTERIGRILAACKQALNLTDGTEITLEANPNTLTANMVRDLQGMGFTRLSMGLQSTHAHELALLGRRHSYTEAAEAVGWAGEAGFEHISLDLMIGLPGQTEADVRLSVEKVAGLSIDHLSVYLLKREKNTPFYALYSDMDEDVLAELYLAAVSEIEKQGFAQYEISNFARPGGQSRHNLKYWQLSPYLGIGPSAHSFVDGRRAFFPRDLDAFINAADPFSLWQDDGPGGGADEYIMLGLRLTEGIDLWHAAELGADAELIARRAEPLISAGYAHMKQGRLGLTPTGFLISNTIIGHLIG